MNCIDVYWNEGHLFSVINTPFCIKSCRRCVTLCQASILVGRGGEENHPKYKEGSIKVDRMILIDDLEASKVMFTLTQTKWWKKGMFVVYTAEENDDISMKANANETLDHGALLLFSSILYRYHSIDFLLQTLFFVLFGCVSFFQWSSTLIVS